MTEESKKELQLIGMVERMQAEQREYFVLKAKYGGATQQLDKCKKLEKELKNYCADRRKILEEVPVQKSLF